MESNGGVHTAREIAGQPELWIKTWQMVTEQNGELAQFLGPVLDTAGLEVVMTGAGTSAFIGAVAEPLLNRQWPCPVRSLPTTTLVTHFDDYIDTGNPLLLISFARSGNSPESMAVVSLAEERCEQKVYHLVITCNPEGRLAREVPGSNRYLFLLPPEAEDRSLAMTGSFTSMLLAVLLMSRPGEAAGREEDVTLLAEYGRAFLDRYPDEIEKLAELDFNRAVFLGSGPMLGIARESHLKLQELTDGEVICKYDSFLGFRHGPKAVIDEQTLLLYLFSGEPGVLRYEADLANDVSENGFGLASVGVYSSNRDGIKTDVAIELVPAGAPAPGPALTPLLSVLPAQVLGFHSSLKWGLKPDSPSASGAISRVVEGVTIYPTEIHNK